MTCTLCKDVLTDYKLRHNEEACPLKASLMCTFCNRSGHSNIMCTKGARLLRIKGGSMRNVEHLPALDVRLEDRNICAYLRSQGIQPSQKPKKNLEILREYTERIGIIVRKK